MTLPNSLIEKVFFGACLSPYLVYFGGLGPLAPLLLAWPLILLGLFIYLRDGLRPPLLAVVWCFSCVGILAEEFVTLYARGVGMKHLPWWFLTYALAAFLPMVGALIRPAVLSTAAALLGVQTLVYVAAALVATAAGVIEMVEYKSIVPSSLLGNQDLFKVHFLAPDYVFDREWRLVAFAPYTPFAGATAIMFSMLVLTGANCWLKWAGFAGWFALMICTHSRMGLVAMTTCIAIFALVGWGRRWLGLVLGVLLLGGVMFAGPLLHFREKASSFVHSARLNSSQDRENLRAIAFDNWRYGEHQILGAGESVPGGQIVNKVYIGDLDSLGAMLFLRGAVGFCLTLLPILFTWVYGFSGGRHAWFRGVTCIATALMFYAYSQSLKDLFMYFWPVFLFIGAVASRDRSRAPASDIPPALPATP
jgi:hypothetical protein